MDGDATRARFDDLSAGFTDWERRGTQLGIVACQIWSSETHSSAWIAAAAPDRRSAAALLKGFGVHGLKFTQPPTRLAPRELMDASAEEVGRVHFLDPDTGLLAPIEERPA